MTSLFYLLWFIVGVIAGINICLIAKLIIYMFEGEN